MKDDLWWIVLLQYLFVVTMFAANTVASMAIEGYFDKQEDLPFVDAAKVFGSPKFEQYHHAAATESINRSAAELAKSLEVGGNVRLNQVSDYAKGFASDVAEEGAETLTDWFSPKSFGIALLIKVLEYIYNRISIWFVGKRNF